MPRYSFLAVQTADTSDDTVSEAVDPTTAGPIDLDHLGRYTYGDKSLEQEILGLFCGQSDDLFAQMKRAASLPEWKFATHSLKGSARAVGAWAVAELAAEAEMCDPQSPERADLIERIAAEIALAQRYVADTYGPALKQTA
jgi:HPt (histidine-containing phosphotransfer) domain-containing protein